MRIHASFSIIGGSGDILRGRKGSLNGLSRLNGLKVRNEKTHFEIQLLSSHSQAAQGIQVLFAFNPQATQAIQAIQAVLLFGKGISIAFTGHSAAQKPHSSHRSSSMQAFPSLNSMAPGGHTSQHVAHPVHVSLSTTGIIRAPSLSGIHRGSRSKGVSASSRPR